MKSPCFSLGLSQGKNKGIYFKTVSVCRGAIDKIYFKAAYALFFVD
jgi:hypothetical protein